MWSCNLAPDHPDLRSPDFSVCTVDECHFLAKVEAGSISAINCGEGCIRDSYVAALGSSTPSIFIRLANRSVYGVSISNVFQYSPRAGIGIALSSLVAEVSPPKSRSPWSTFRPLIVPCEAVFLRSWRAQDQASMGREASAQGDILDVYCWID